MNTVTYNNLTAEIAEHAEVISAMIRPQEILFSGAAACYLLFSALSASSAVNKIRIRINLFGSGMTGSGFSKQHQIIIGPDV